MDSSTAPCILSICATVASMAFTFALAFAACLFPAALLWVLLIMIVVFGRANVRDRKIAILDAVINERIVAKERGRSRGSSCNRPFPVEGP